MFFAVDNNSAICRLKYVVGHVNCHQCHKTDTFEIMSLNPPTIDIAPDIGAPYEAIQGGETSDVEHSEAKGISRTKGIELVHKWLL